jgi:sigma-B regulation protein RsbU (phosphoserine phosphatase)
VSLDRVGLERLRAIVAPFDGLAEMAITIRDMDGRALASSIADGDPGSIEVADAIVSAGAVLGRVAVLGPDGPLNEAVARSLATSIGALAGSLTETEATDAERATKVRLEAELALGRRIQRSLVPLVAPEVAGYEIASHYEAAQVVGGDFFDVFRVYGHDDQLALCVADVTGKGIAAALLMAFARPLLRAAIDHTAAPVAGLERTNQILVEEGRSALFITALCAIVDLDSGLVRLANAGHEPPLVVPAGDGTIAWLEGSGPLLGAFRRLDLVERSVVLAPGDLLLLYTDGVTDARASDGRRFGDERLVEVLESTRGASAAAVVEAIRDACHRFADGTPMADDITIVAIRRSELG